MTGLKYKLAHKRAEKEKWSSTDKAQRKRLIQILQEMIAQLKLDVNMPGQENPVPLLIKT
ncbi:MAG TPA: hypothetical protein VF884_13870 [Nitrososphaeraceae archaeon]